MIYRVRISRLADYANRNLFFEPSLDWEPKSKQDAEGSKQKGQLPTDLCLLHTETQRL
jgi:hypothetical protein